MSSSSVKFVRKPFTVGQIQQQFRDSEDQQTTLMSLYHHLLAEGFDAEGNEEHDLVIAMELAKSGTNFATYVQDLGLTNSQESTSPEKKLKIAKLLLLGHGSTSIPVLQVLRELSGNQIEIDDPLLTKEKREEWEANKKILITYLYTHGKEEDREFLRTHFGYDNSYFQMVEDMAVTGGEWVTEALTAVMAVPTTLTDIYNTWRMSRNLQANALEKAKYKALNDLASAANPERFERFQGPSIEELSDEEFDEPESVKGKEKSNTGKGKEKSRASKTKASAASKPRTWFNFGLSASTQDSLALSQRLGDSVRYEDEKEKGEVKNLNVSLTSSFFMMERPEPPTSLLKVEEQLAGSTHGTATEGSAFDTNNLRILAQNCRRIDDAKAHDYYTAEEAQKIVAAKKLREECSYDNGEDLLVLLEGARTQKRHLRYGEEIDRLNNPVESPFAKLRHQHIVDEEIIRKIDALKLEWQRRAGLASLSSASLVNLTKNVEAVFLYIQHAQDELENDSHRNTESWGAAILAIQDLEKLAKQTQAEIVEAMLERLKLVPQADLEAIDSFNNDHAYFDDLVCDTLNSLVPYGLSEQFFIQYAQQTHPTQGLTVALIKQFISYIKDHIKSYINDSQKQQEEFDNLLGIDRPAQILIQEDEQNLVIVTKLEQEQRLIYVPKPQGALALKAKLAEEKAAKEKENEKTNPLMQSSGWFEYGTDNVLHFPESLPDVDVPDDDADFIYMFVSEQDKAALALAADYFSRKVNQQYFAKKINQYVFEHPGIEINDAECLTFAFEKTAEYLIEKEAELFDRPSLAQAKEHFVDFAEESSFVFFIAQTREPKFEAAVLDQSYDAIVAIESRANEIIRELKALNATPANLKIYRETFIKAAYEHLLATGNVDEANILGKKAVYILRYVKLVPESKQVQYLAIANKCIDNSNDPFNEDNWVAGLKTAEDAINLIKVLKEERRRINKPTWKSFFMSSACTVEKTEAFGDKVKELRNIDSTETFAALQQGLLADDSGLIKKRGWLSFFPCTESKTEENLRKFINNETPERNVIKIKQ